MGTGDVPRGVGDVVRSSAVPGGVPELGDPGSGGRGIEGGGVGKIVAPDLRALEDEVLLRPRAAAAASGDSESRLGCDEELEVRDKCLNALSCCCETLVLSR